MKNTIKLLSLFIILSVSVVACGDKSEECKDGDKKECCSKEDADSATTEVIGDEQAHICTKACAEKGASCPHHTD
mgnify:FL=1